MDWKKTLATVAPTLATALGGPLAGTAMSAITEVLGLNPEDGAGAELAVLAGSPETLARLKEAELTFQKEMAELDVDLERIHAGDRDSARRRNSDMQDSTPAVMGFLILVGFFGAFAASLVLDPPAAARSTIDIMLGYLGGMATGVVSFYFGSSVGSKQKTELLSRGERHA